MPTPFPRSSPRSAAPASRGPGVPARPAFPPFEAFSHSRVLTLRRLHVRYLRPEIRLPYLTTQVAHVQPSKGQHPRRAEAVEGWERRECRNAGAPGRRGGGTQGRRNAGAPERRNSGGAGTPGAPERRGRRNAREPERRGVPAFEAKTQRT